MSRDGIDTGPTAPGMVAVTYSMAAAGGTKTLPSWRMTSVGAWIEGSSGRTSKSQSLHHAAMCPRGRPARS